MCESDKHQGDGDQTVSKQGWNHTPDEPISLSPMFDWPPSPVKTVQWHLAGWVAISIRIAILGLAILTWFFLQPDLARMATFQIDWVFEIYVRNLVLMTLVAGGLHLWLHSYNKQGMEYKFDPRDQARNSRAFHFRNQVHDNMFWTLASGVTVWTLFETVTMWGYANGYVPWLSWTDNPVWFVALFLLQPIWGSFHFYWIHRVLHWPPLYRLAHALHHRNINVGPWSGMSMHPIEHILYLSSGMIHWIVASHPIHFLFHMQSKVLEAATSHSGYDRLLVNKLPNIELGDFFHQLHHRFFECNYGTLEMPWDRWFGTFHSGTETDAERMKERRRKMHG